MSGFERSLTNEALADRLRRIADNPRSWPNKEKFVYLMEAARRLEKKEED